MTTCTECTAPARGPVPDLEGVPAHTCRQCGDHCQMRAYLVDPAPLYTPTSAEIAEQRRSALEQLERVALPEDAPGAWVRAAIRSERARP